MKKGFIVPLIIFAILGVSAYFFVTKSQVTSNQKSIDIANLTTKYPNAQSWEVSPGRSICPFHLAECTSPPTTIKFASLDPWVTVYGYYVPTMKGAEWGTNTIIITSVPASVVFTNGQNCQATLNPASEALNGADGTKHYDFSFNC